jgi:hypothetical protein
MGTKKKIEQVGFFTGLGTLAEEIGRLLALYRHHPSEVVLEKYVDEMYMHIQDHGGSVFSYLYLLVERLDMNREAVKKAKEERIAKGISKERNWHRENICRAKRKFGINDQEAEEYIKNVKEFGYKYANEKLPTEYLISAKNFSKVCVEFDLDKLIFDSADEAAKWYRSRHPEVTFAQAKRHVKVCILANRRFVDRNKYTWYRLSIDQS